LSGRLVLWAGPRRSKRLHRVRHLRRTDFGRAVRTVGKSNRRRALRRHRVPQMRGGRRARRRHVTWLHQSLRIGSGGKRSICDIGLRARRNGRRSCCADWRDARAGWSAVGKTNAPVTASCACAATWRAAIPMFRFVRRRRALTVLLDKLPATAVRPACRARRAASARSTGPAYALLERVTAQASASTKVPIRTIADCVHVLAAATISA